MKKKPNIYLPRTGNRGNGTQIGTAHLQSVQQHVQRFDPHNRGGRHLAMMLVFALNHATVRPELVKFRVVMHGSLVDRVQRVIDDNAFQL